MNGVGFGVLEKATVGGAKLEPHRSSTRTGMWGLRRAPATLFLSDWGWREDT